MEFTPQVKKFEKYTDRILKQTSNKVLDTTDKVEKQVIELVFEIINEVLIPPPITNNELHPKWQVNRAIWNKKKGEYFKRLKGLLEKPIDDTLNILDDYRKKAYIGSYKFWIDTFKWATEWKVKEIKTENPLLESVDLLELKGNPDAGWDTMGVVKSYADLATTKDVIYDQDVFRRMLPGGFTPNDVIKTLGTQTYDDLKGSILDGVNKGFGMEKIRAEFAKKQNVNLKKWENSRKAGKTSIYTMPELALDVVMSSTPGQLIANVVTSLSFNLLRTIRTEVMKGGNAAAIRSFKDNSDILTGYRRQSAGDKRTCPACLAMDGTFYPIEGMPKKPITPIAPVKKLPEKQKVPVEFKLPENVRNLKFEDFVNMNKDEQVKIFDSFINNGLPENYSVKMRADFPNSTFGRLNGRLYHGKNMVGEISRKLDYDMKEVTRVSFFIDKGDRGKGIAGALMKNEDAFYKSLGFKHSTLTPAYDGRYIWSHYGYEFENKTIRDKVLGEVNREYETWQIAKGIKFENIKKFNHEREFIDNVTFWNEDPIYLGEDLYKKL